MRTKKQVTECDKVMATARAWVRLNCPTRIEFGESKGNIKWHIDVQLNKLALKYQACWEFGWKGNGNQMSNAVAWNDIVQSFEERFCKRYDNAYQTDNKDAVQPSLIASIEEVSA